MRRTYKPVVITNDCGKCKYFFVEWDDQERRQIDWCWYITGRMTELCDLLVCPREQEAAHE